jgi:hypothetical protein
MDRTEFLKTIGAGGLGIAGIGMFGLGISGKGDGENEALEIIVISHFDPLGEYAPPEPEFESVRVVREDFYDWVGISRWTYRIIGPRGDLRNYAQQWAEYVIQEIRDGLGGDDTYYDYFPDWVDQLDMLCNAIGGCKDLHRWIEEEHIKKYGVGIAQDSLIWS